MEESSVQVIVRPRPQFLSNSLPLSSSDSLEISKDNKAVSITRERKGTSEFTFDHVLSPEATQLDLYLKCNSVISTVINGTNCCIMMYGQTSSGKTYAMLGEDPSSSSASSGIIDVTESEKAGLLPRCLEDLFSQLETNAASNEHYIYSIQCQFMQIYNEKIFDLVLDKKKQIPLAIKQCSSKGSTSVRVSGISEYRVDKKDDVMLLLKRALGNRSLRSTEMNLESSRSHTILQLFLRVESASSNNIVTIRESTFSFVDLAGSEKTSVSASVESLRESTNINTSLHVLGKCVAALTEPNRKHIPFRDSQLTRLLQVQYLNKLSLFNSSFFFLFLSIRIV